MKTSESIIKIAPALLSAQKEMEGAKKDSNNPFFKSKYADYNAVLEACKGPLNNNGISILQPHRIEVSESSTFMVVETILLHESGEFISGETKVEVAKANDPQALGSSQSYARRYGLQSIVSLPSEDDDANLGSGKQAQQAPAKPAPAPKSDAKPSSFGASAQPDKPEVKSSGFGGVKTPARSGSFGS